MKKDELKKETEKIKLFAESFRTPNPNRDWLTVLGSVAVFFILVGLWSIAAYFLYSPQAPDSADITLPTQEIDSKRLSNVLMQYQKRQTDFSALQAGSSTPFVDPSL